MRALIPIFRRAGEIAKERFPEGCACAAQLADCLRRAIAESTPEPSDAYGSAPGQLHRDGSIWLSPTMRAASGQVMIREEHLAEAEKRGWERVEPAELVANLPPGAKPVVVERR